MATTGANTVVLTLTVEQAEAIKNLQAFQKKMEASFQKQLAEAKKTSDGITKLFRFEVLTKGAGLLFRGLKEGFKAVQDVLRALGLDLQETLGRAAPKQVDALKKALDGVEDQLAKSVNQSGAFKDGVDAFTKAIKEFTKFLGEPATIAAINGFFAGIARGLANIIDAALGAKKMFEDLKRGNLGAPTTKADFLLGKISDPETSAENRQRYIEQLREIRRLEGEAPPPVNRLPSGTSNFADQLRTVGSAGVVAPTAIGARKGEGEKAKKGIDFSSYLDPIREAQLAQPQIEIDRAERIKVAIAALKDEYDQIKSAQAFEAEDLRLQMESEQRDLANASHIAWTSFKEQVRDVATGAMTDLFVGIGESIAQGGANILEVMSGFVGGMIKQIGVLLIQLGTAALAFQLLSLIPGFQGLTGGPGIGAVAGVAAIAIGTGLVAIGSAIGAAGSSEGETPSAPSGGGGGGSSQGNRQEGSGIPRGFDGSRTGSGTPSQVTFVINGGFFGSDKRAAGRYLADVLAASGALQPGGR